MSTNAADIIKWGYEQKANGAETVDFDEAVRLYVEMDGETPPTDDEIPELKTKWDEEFHIARLEIDGEEIEVEVLPELDEATIDEIDETVRNLEAFVEQKQFENDSNAAWKTHEEMLEEVRNGKQQINGLRRQQIQGHVQSARCDNCNDEYPAEYLELVKKCNSCGMPFIQNDVVGSFEECPACHSKNVEIATTQGCPICYNKCEVRTLYLDRIGETWLTKDEWDAKYFWDGPEFVAPDLTKRLLKQAEAERDAKPEPIKEPILDEGPKIGKGGIDYSAWEGRQVGVSQKSWAGCIGEVVEMDDKWTSIRMTQAPKELKSQVGKQYRTRTKNVFPINGQNWTEATK